jgi:hypothetical protein
VCSKSDIKVLKIRKLLRNEKVKNFFKMKKDEICSFESDFKIISLNIYGIG